MNSKDKERLKILLIGGTIVVLIILFGG